MLKRLLLLAGLLSLVATSAHASGTIPISMTQQLDQFGKPLGGCFLYIIQAGTTSTPQDAFQDSGLTQKQPNPMRCDAAGRLPQFFLADGVIKIRLTDRNGVSQNFPGASASGLDNILVIGPSAGGGGGGGSVDPTTILQTGDFKLVYNTGVLTGFVRANGRTIGSATSGATERANADTQALFQYLWGADANLAVSGGRGASAAADWAANKTIALPDLRGRSIAGLDGMGNSPAGRLGSGAGSFGTNNDTLGFAGGKETHTLTSPSQLPPHTHANTLSDPGHVHDLANSRQASAGTSGAVFVAPRLDGGYVPGQVPTILAFTGITINNASVGASAAFDTMSPTMLMTIYVKL